MGATAKILNYAAEVWRYRYFWLSLVRVDLSTRYRGSFLGVGWSLLKPIAMTAVVCVVFGQMFQVRWVDFAPSLLIGLSFWAFISESVLGGCTSFHVAEGYIRQMRLPLAMFPLRVTLGAAFHFLVSLPLVLATVTATKGFPSPGALATCGAVFVVLVLLGWSLAVLGGLVQVYFPDMRHILEIALQLLFYATPILYPAELLRSRAGGRLILDANPLAAMVEQIRSPLLTGVAGPPASLAFVLAFVCATMVLAATLLGRLERRLVFWL
jgi:lipopolysaccharide transport system permease protein